MVSTFTTGKMHLEKPAAGDYVDAWAPPINANFDNADSAVSTSAAVSITSADVTLTQAQARNLHINCSGALSATRQLIFPNTADGLVGGIWIITNGCTNNFTLTAIVRSGTGIIIPQGKRMVIFSDGTNMFGGDDWIANAIATTGASPNGVLSGNPGNTARPIADLLWDNVNGFLYFATGGTGWKRVAPNFPLVAADITDGQVTNVKLAGPRMTAQVLTAGTAATYTTPANCKSILGFIIAGGGGGSATNTNGGASGGNSIFDAFQVNGGGGGTIQGSNSLGGAGGAGGAGGSGFRIAGSAGENGQNGADFNVPGPTGAPGIFGMGAGRGSSGNGGAAFANSGAGGAGGAGTNTPGSGGSGEFGLFVFNSLAASYLYTIGAGGNGGAAGGNAGGNGGSGVIIILEFY